MSLIGNLTLGFSVVTGAAERGMKRMRGVVAETAGGLRSLAGSAVGLTGALAGVAGIAGIGAMLKSSFEGIDQLGLDAQKLGATVEGLSALRYAATLSDVEVETLQGGLQKLSVKLGEASSGSKSARNAIAQLGLDADTVTKLPITDAFAQIADKIAALSSPAEQAAAAVAIFGRSGVELLPLLQQGAAGIAAMRTEAASMGAIITTDQVNAVDAADQALKRVQAALGGVFNQVVGQLAPVITDLSQRLVESGFFGEQMSGLIATGIEMVATGIAYAVDAIKYFQAAWYGIKMVVGLVLTGISALITANIALWGQAINGLVEALGFARIQALDEAANVATDFTRGLAEESMKAGRDMEAVLARPSAVDGVKGFFENMRSGANEAATAMKSQTVPAAQLLSETTMQLGDDISKLSDEWAEQAATFGMSTREAKLYALAQQGASDAQLEQLKALDAQLTEQERLKKLQDEGKQIFEETRTPLEAYEAQLGKLREMLDAGAIDQETFNRATAKAETDLKSSGGGGSESRFAGIATAGSVEAMRTLNASRNLGRNDPMSNLTKTADRQLDETKLQTTLLRQLVGTEEQTFNLN